MESPHIPFHTWGQVERALKLSLGTDNMISSIWNPWFSVVSTESTDIQRAESYDIQSWYLLCTLHVESSLMKEINHQFVHLTLKLKLLPLINLRVIRLINKVIEQISRVKKWSLLSKFLDQLALPLKLLKILQNASDICFSPSLHTSDIWKLTPWLCQTCIVSFIFK